MLNIGTSIMIEPVNSDHERYRCKVADIEENRIYIDYPIDIQTNRTVFLLNSQSLDIIFIDKKQNAFKFRTQVAGRIKKEIPLIILELPEKEKIEKIQRRQFVRVETTVDAALRFNESDIHIPTVTTDISAGGCAVILPVDSAPVKHEHGEGIFVLPMQTGDYHYLRLAFKVIRSWEEAGNRKVSLQFKQIQEKDQQLLIRFCFIRQLQQRKKQVDSAVII
jgi:c-di-GMP-binding flagellar brake protein YcgR